MRVLEGPGQPEAQNGCFERVLGLPGGMPRRRDASGGVVKRAFWLLVTFGSLWGALGAILATLGPWKMKRGPLWSAKPRVSFSERKARVGSEIIPD